MNTDPDAVRDAARALLADAMGLAKQGDTATALRIFDEVIRRLTADAHPDSQALVASALFNRSVALRFARETDAAVAAFDAVIERFSAAAAPEVMQWVALARYNKGYAFLDAGRQGEALAAFDAFVADCAASPNPQVRERVATALYQSGVIWRDLGNDERARSLFAKILDDFGNAPEPAVQQIIARLIGTGDGRIDPTAPAAHARANALSLDIRADLAARIERDPAHAAEYRASLEAAERLDQHDAERAAALHRDAVAILTAHRERLEPFSLFLRNFDLEAYDRIGIGAEGPQRIAFNFAAVQKTETDLGAALRNRVPVIAIANPHIVRSDYRHAFPKLELPTATWRAVLQELVAGASLIVMQVTDLSPGVLSELQTILWHHQADVTVVMLSEREADPLTDALTTFYKIDEPRRASLQELRAGLTAFPRVVSEPDVPFDNLDSSPAFADVLRTIAFVQALSPDQRANRRRIEALNRAASENMARASREAAIPQLEEARAINASVGDTAQAIRTESLLGVAYHEQGTYPAALAAFTEALTLARNAGNRADEGAFLRDIGNCLRALGAYADAVARFREALPILKETAPALSVEATREMAMAYESARDTESAVECYQQALAEYENAGDRTRAMEVHMQIGTAYFQAERYLETIASFEAAIGIARELDAADAEAVSRQMIDKARSRTRGL